MRLHEIPKGSKLVISLKRPDDKDYVDQVCTFHHVDGMFSYCTVDAWESDGVFHLSAVTPLVKEGDYYRIDDKGAEDDLPTEEEKKATK